MGKIDPTEELELRVSAFKKLKEILDDCVQGDWNLLRSPIMTRRSTGEHSTGICSLLGDAIFNDEISGKEYDRLHIELDKLDFLHLGSAYKFSPGMLHPRKVWVLKMLTEYENYEARLRNADLLIQGLLIMKEDYLGGVEEMSLPPGLCHIANRCSFRLEKISPDLYGALTRRLENERMKRGFPKLEYFWPQSDTASRIEWLDDQLLQEQNKIKNIFIYLEKRFKDE